MAERLVLVVRPTRPEQIPLDECDEQDGTPLHYAAKKGFLELAKALVEAGARVDPVNCKNMTPLHLASHYNRMDVGRFLILKNANVAAVDHIFRTPLHYACLKSHINSVRQLLEWGAEPMAIDNKGKLPLHLVGQSASQKNRGKSQEIIKLLKAKMPASELDALDKKYQKNIDGTLMAAAASVAKKSPRRASGTSAPTEAAIEPNGGGQESSVNSAPPGDPPPETPLSGQGAGNGDGNENGNGNGNRNGDEKDKKEKEKEQEGKGMDGQGGSSAPPEGEDGREMSGNGSSVLNTGNGSSVLNTGNGSSVLNTGDTSLRGEKGIRPQHSPERAERVPPSESGSKTTGFGGVGGVSGGYRKASAPSLPGKGSLGLGGGGSDGQSSGPGSPLMGMSDKPHRKKNSTINLLMSDGVVSLGDGRSGSEGSPNRKRMSGITTVVGGTGMHPPMVHMGVSGGIAGARSMRRSPQGSIAGGSSTKGSEKDESEDVSNEEVAYEMALEQIIADLEDLEERVENLNVDQKTNEDILLNVLRRVDEAEKDLRKMKRSVKEKEFEKRRASATPGSIEGPTLPDPPATPRLQSDFSSSSSKGKGGYASVSELGELRQAIAFKDKELRDIRNKMEDREGEFDTLKKAGKNLRERLDEKEIELGDMAERVHAIEEAAVKIHDARGCNCTLM